MTQFRFLGICLPKFQGNQEEYRMTRYKNYVQNLHAGAMKFLPGTAPKVQRLTTDPATWIRPVSRGIEEIVTAYALEEFISCVTGGCRPGVLIYGLNSISMSSRPREENSLARYSDSFLESRNYLCFPRCRNSSCFPRRGSKCWGLTRHLHIDAGVFHGGVWMHTPLPCGRKTPVRKMQRVVFPRFGPHTIY